MRSETYLSSSRGGVRTRARKALALDISQLKESRCGGGRRGRASTSQGRAKLARVKRLAVDRMQTSPSAMLRDNERGALAWEAREQKGGAS